MRRSGTGLILGYHGCDATVAESLLAGEAFKASRNEYDWLGDGAYFGKAILNGAFSGPRP